MKILEQMTPTFQQVFDDSDISLSRDTTADDIAGWDSLSHMNLIVAMELKFKIKFALGELQKLKNVGQMADLITKKVAAKG